MSYITRTQKKVGISDEKFQALTADNVQMKVWSGITTTKGRDALFVEEKTVT